MKNQTFCLALSGAFGIPELEQIPRLKAAGFDGFFIGWRPNTDVAAYKKVADENGMFFQSLHAPFIHVHHFWEEGPETEALIEEQLACLRAAADNGIDLVVTHAFIGFGEEHPNELGIKNFARVAEEAKRLKVRVALENTEGLGYLKVLMDAFKDNPYVGFCWDSGHDQCYNPKELDLLKMYGDRLIGTHLNDNFGIRDPKGFVTWHDDLHLLPYDGIIDWQWTAQRLNDCGYNGPLTLELAKGGAINSRYGERYAAMDLDAYLADVYSRVARFAYTKHLDAVRRGLE